jgi:predicted dehydrogenase
MIKKILIQGAGSAGTRHLKIAKSLFPLSEIATFTNRSNSQLNENCNLHFSEIEDAIRFKPDIAVIAGASSSRLDIGLGLASSGAHLLVEKPISNSVNGVRNLINICKEKKTILAVGYNLRFDESLMNFRDNINSQIIGKPLLINCEVGQFLPSWRENIDYRETVSANHKLGGGVLLELSHEIDYLGWIFGGIKWVRATVMKQSSLEIDVEDSAFLTLGFENRSNPDLVANLSMDFIRQDKRRKCVVVGDKGTLKWDGVNQKVSFLKKDDTNWKILFKANSHIDESYVKEWTDFVECINFGNSPKVNGLDGLNALEVIESALESAPTGTQIQVNRS